MRERLPIFHAKPRHPRVGPIFSSTPEVYVGLLDLVSGAAAAYSVARKLQAAYTGSLIRIRRASDNVEQDFGALSSGGLDTASIATFLSATTGAIATIYDQSGNARNVTQATAGNQPAYVASAQNGRPTARFTAASSHYLENAAVATAFSGEDMPLTAFAAAAYDNVATGTTKAVWGFGSSASAAPLFHSGATATPDFTSVRRNDGSTLITLTGGVPVEDQFVIDETVFPGTTLTRLINGTTVINAGAMDVATATFNRFCYGARARSAVELLMDGDEPELVLWPSALSSGNRTLIRANQAAYYGVAVV